MFQRLMERFTERWRMREYRRYFWLFLAAKIAGVLLCLAIIKGVTTFLFTPAFADDHLTEPRRSGQCLVSLPEFPVTLAA